MLLQVCLCSSRLWFYVRRCKGAPASLLLQAMLCIEEATAKALFFCLCGKATNKWVPPLVSSCGSVINHMLCMKTSKVSSGC